MVGEVGIEKQPEDSLAKEVADWARNHRAAASVFVAFALESEGAPVVEGIVSVAKHAVNFLRLFGLN